MKKFLLLIFAFVCIKSYAQTNGLTYQAVIFNPASQNAVEKPLANQKVCMQFKIVTNDFQVDYEEYIQTTTDQFGAVNLLIGSGTRVGGLVNSIDKINWGVGRKNLVVSINIYGNCVTYTEISNQPFTAVPFAMYAANGASASSSSKGVIQLAGDLAGTGSSADKPIISTDAITTNKIKNLAVTDEKIANGISASKVGLGNVNNTSDLDKPISTAVKAALDKKVNVADAESMMLPLAKQAETVASLNTKVNVADTAAMLNPYAKQAATNSAIALKVNIADTATMLNPYAKSAATLAGLNTKVNIADTAAMLNPYAKSASTLASLNTKVNIADTAAMLNSYAKTITTQNLINQKVNIADTAAMLSPYAKSATTLAGLNTKVNIADTAAMLNPYAKQAATQTALNAKANAADLDAKAPIASPTFTGTVSGITKSMVGLGNVDNTSDANKPVSTATQTALNAKANAADLDAKAPIASPTFTGTVSGITKSMVGLGNVDNTSDANKPVSTATQTALNAKANAADLDAKAPIASPTFTGTVSGITKSMVGLGNVDNTSDANKPVSTATQTALNAKAALASPTFTGVPVAPTAAASSNNTQIATTEYVDRQVTLSGGVMDKKVNEMNNLNVTGLKTIFMSNIDGISGSITNLIGGTKGQSINLVFTPSVFSDYMYVTFQTGGNIGVSYNRSIYSFYSGKIELIFDGTYWRVMTSDYW